MTTRSNPTDPKGLRDEAPEQKGSALVMAIFVLVLLTGMGTALLFLSQSEVKMSQASVHAKQAFYLAEAALEDARLSLWTINKGEPFDDDLVTAAGANGNIEFDPDNIQAVYDADGNVTGFTGYGDDVPLTAMTGMGDGWYVAFLTNDPGESAGLPLPVGLTDRTRIKTDSNDRVMITGVGAGPDRSFEVVQAIIEVTQLFPSVPPATITMLGPSPFFDGGDSNAKKYIGDDCGGSGLPGLYVPVIGAVGAAAVADPCPPLGNSVTCGIIKPNSYDTGFGLYSGNDTAANIIDPGVYGGLGPIDPAWLNCKFLHDLADDVERAADVICVPPAPCAWPPSTPLRTIFVLGDWTLGPTISGEGLLFVTGELVMSGQADWRGMIYVVGEGRFVRSGAGNGETTGAVFVADIAGPDNIFRTDDDCTGGVNGFARASFDESGGGTGNTIFCTEDITPALPVIPYDIVEFRQR